MDIEIFAHLNSLKTLSINSRPIRNPNPKAEEAFQGLMSYFDSLTHRKDDGDQTAQAKIEAEYGVEAEEKFIEMSLKDLLIQSQYASNGTEQKIRLVVASVHDNLEAEDWQERKEHL